MAGIHVTLKIVVELNAEAALTVDLVKQNVVSRLPQRLTVKG
jgi:hypothetical protein